MKVVSSCPNCNVPGLLVPNSAVSYQTNEDVLDSDWYACLNKDCAVAYFEKEVVFDVSMIVEKLWYKDSDDDVYICYCSKLSRGDIREAVQSGARTIDEVQEYTGKNRTGHCEKENPVGGCCREVFLFEVRKCLEELEV